MSDAQRRYQEWLDCEVDRSGLDREKQALYRVSLDRSAEAAWMRLRLALEDFRNAFLCIETYAILGTVWMFVLALAVMECFI